MITSIEFSIPDERDNLELALDAGKYKSALIHTLELLRQRLNSTESNDVMDELEVIIENCYGVCEDLGLEI